MPTEQDYLALLNLLSTCITGLNGAVATDEIAKYRSHPLFPVLLSDVMVADTVEALLPSTGAGAAASASDWLHYRVHAALQLAIFVRIMSQRAGPHDSACLERPAAAAVKLLQEGGHLPDAAKPGTERLLLTLLRSAAQIVSYVTRIVGLGAWSSMLGVDLGSILAAQLTNPSAPPCRVCGVLSALTYIVEDAQREVGRAVADIVKVVAPLVVAKERKLEVRIAAFRLLLQVFEKGNECDWKRANLSPLQEGLCSTAWCFAVVATDLAREILLHSNPQAAEAAAANAIFNGALIPCVALPPNDDGLRTLRDLFYALLLLLDYMPYLVKDGGDDLGRFAQWVEFAIGTVAAVAKAGPSNDLRDEAAAEACRFLSTACDSYNSSEGDSVHDRITCVLVPQIPVLVKSLLPLMVMSDAEFESMIENDEFSQRDAVSGGFGVSKRHSRFSRPGPGAADDGDNTAASATLRAASACLLESVCILDPIRVFPIVQGEIEAQWLSKNWKLREVILLALGTVANGAYSELSNYLVEIVPQIIRSLTEPLLTPLAPPGNVHDPNAPNRCIVTMASWTLARIGLFFFENEVGRGMMGSLIPSLLSRFMSPSKRVQESTLNSITLLLHQSTSARVPLPNEWLVRIIEASSGCIPHYHSLNLSYLGGLLELIFNEWFDVLTAEEGQSALRVIEASVASSFEPRWESFNKTYSIVVNGGSSERGVELVDKDIFILADLRCALMEKISQKGATQQVQQQGMFELARWTSVLSGINKRLSSAAEAARAKQGVDVILDDLELIRRPAQICARIANLYLDHTGNEQLQAVCAQVLHASIELLYHLATVHEALIPSDRSPACGALCGLLSVLAELLPPESLPSLLAGHAQPLFTALRSTAVFDTEAEIQAGPGAAGELCQGSAGAWETATLAGSLMAAASGLMLGVGMGPTERQFGESLLQACGSILNVIAAQIRTDALEEMEQFHSSMAIYLLNLVIDNGLLTAPPNTAPSTLVESLFSCNTDPSRQGSATELLCRTSGFICNLDIGEEKDSATARYGACLQWLLERHPMNACHPAIDGYFRILLTWHESMPEGGEARASAPQVLRSINSNPEGRAILQSLFEHFLPSGPRSQAIMQYYGLQTC